MWWHSKGRSESMRLCVCSIRTRWIAIIRIGWNGNSQVNCMEIIVTLKVIPMVCQRQSPCYPDSGRLSLCRMAFEHLCNRFLVIRWVVHICPSNCALWWYPLRMNWQNSPDAMTYTSTFERINRWAISGKKKRVEKRKKRLRKNYKHTAKMKWSKFKLKWKIIRRK